jgi:long-chain acyl-CoA synthetase
MVSRGCCIAYCDGIKHIADNLKEYQISVMVSVPILFEAMYKRVVKAIKKKGKWETVEKGVKISNTLLKVGIDVRKKLFKEIHDNFGGKVRLFVAGGAALDPETEKGFCELGIDLYQGYGLTETAPVVASECKGNRKLGSIGRKFHSLEVKIDEPDEDGIGELMVKGPSVMLGYYHNDEATKSAIEEDGWFHTGDLAKIDKDGYIFVSGRKKSVIVLKNGKNIFPEELEILLNKIEGVKESMVYGRPDDRDSREGDLRICAKIVYDKDFMKEHHNIEGEEAIKDFLWQEVKNINKEMPAYKYIRDIMVTEEELIKTTTVKVKRHEEMKKILSKK